MSQSKEDTFDSMISTLRSALDKKEDTRVCPRKRTFEEMLETCYGTPPIRRYTSRVRWMGGDGTR